VAFPDYCWLVRLCRQVPVDTVPGCVELPADEPGNAPVDKRAVACLGEVLDPVEPRPCLLCPEGSRVSGGVRADPAILVNTADGGARVPAGVRRKSFVCHCPLLSLHT